MPLKDWFRSGRYERIYIQHTGNDPSNAFPPPPCRAGEPAEYSLRWILPSTASQSEYKITVSIPGQPGRGTSAQPIEVGGSMQPVKPSINPSDIIVFRPIAGEAWHAGVKNRPNVAWEIAPCRNNGVIISLYRKEEFVRILLEQSERSIMIDCEKSDAPNGKTFR